MDGKHLGRLTVYHLDGDDFDSAEYRNQCLVRTRTEYIAYVRGNAVADEELLERLPEEREPFVLVYCRGGQTGRLEYADIFGLIDMPMEALVFARASVRDCGAFHPGLPALTGFEFLCRLVRETDCCVAAALPEDADEMGKIGQDCGDRTSAEAAAMAYTCAYILRLHVPDLREKAAFVYQMFADKMVRMGIADAFSAAMQFLMSDEEAFERLARQTAPFVILRGDDTCGGVLQNFADDLYDALADHGQAVILMGDGFAQHDKLQNMICKGVVGFQSKALEIDFFRRIRGPKFQFWFDNPLRFEKVLRDLPEEYYILCQDGGYAALIREYYQTPNAIQFPPGGRTPKGQQDWRTLRGQEERPYDIVFVGNWFEDSCDTLAGLERELYDYMLMHPDRTFEQGIMELLREKGREPDKEEFIEINRSMKPACRAVIGHYRNAVVSAILEAGFTLDVYGESWNGYEGVGKENLRIHPVVTVEESLRELSKAKIGLNIMSWHKAGMTERIANIMLSGAVCLTEETKYLREHMQDGEEIVCFRLDRLAELPVILGDLLEHPEKREKLAKKAYCKAMAEYTWERRAQELIALSEQATENALTVFVATHVKCNPPADTIYVPLHVGRQGKADLGYLGDDTGENISELNFLYGELTGLFWIWQNVRDLDYVGLCHYRRYFINEQKQAMKKHEYVKLLEEYDAIVPKHAQCEGSYYEHYGASHNRGDLDAVGRALKRLYPDYAAAYDQAMEGTIYYRGNLVVTSLPILRSYAEWLFHIFVEASEEIDVSGYDDYHRRVYGFLSEQMFYVFALANGLNCCETAVGVLEEKAGTDGFR